MGYLLVELLQIVIGSLFGIYFYLFLFASEITLQRFTNNKKAKEDFYMFDFYSMKDTWNGETS